MKGPFHVAVTQPSSLPTHRLFTLTSFPIRYLVIPKCGCTYVKNLIWLLEKRKKHMQPLRVHDDDLAFLRASDLGLTPSEIVREKYAFTVLRRPVDRFYSLYTDKILGMGRNDFHPIADILEKRQQLRLAPVSIEEHRYNCNVLIEWIAENIETRVDLPPDPHWLPQSSHFKLVQMFNLHLLTTAELTDQLGVFLSPLVPDISERLQSIEKNPSGAKIALTDVLDKALKRKINDVYRTDQKIYRGVSVRWREFLNGQCKSIPRSTDVI